MSVQLYADKEESASFEKIFFITVFIEVFTGMIRAGIVALPLGAMLVLPAIVSFNPDLSAVGRGVLIASLLSLAYGYYPFVLSILTWLGVMSMDGRGIVYAIGARRPTIKESEKILGILKEIQEKSEGKTFSKIYIVDGLKRDSFVVGNALFVHRGLFELEQMKGKLAFDVAFLNVGGGRFTQTLRMLFRPISGSLFAGTGAVLPSAYSLSLGKDADADPTKMLNLIMGNLVLLVTSVFFGGLGLRVMSFGWAHFWREKTLQADLEVFNMGYARSLIAYLKEVKAGFDSAVPFSLGFAPYTALRLEALETYLEVDSEKES